ncbi:MBL fold metallo-hydrolase [Myxococcota bacterium]|nr:MBL fold metallo-hydrolase [Myxococcota bacterium]
MGDLLELSERAWQGTLQKNHVHPGRAYLGFEELEPGLGFMSAFSNVGVLDTEEGLVFLDTSSLFHANALHEAIRSWSDKSVHTAVYTHGHVDHVFGLLRFEQEARAKGGPATHVIAHERCPERFERYVLTNGYNAIINQRQFGFDEPVFPDRFREPDETIGKSHSVEVGGIRIELNHDRGETDDHLWAWVPQHRALYTGDLFIWASPNCGNPQKVQRYPRDWSAALRRMQDLRAHWLLPGHGPPIVGEERVARALGETATLLETICDQTLGLMNEGARLDDVIHAVELPSELLERPYLRPIYDDPRFIVRNLWRLYGGWYDGNPAHLIPPREAELAQALASLAGGASAVAAEAERRAANDELELACELAEIAARAAPDDSRVHEVRSAVYSQRAESETSLMAKGIFSEAARQSANKKSSP